MNQFMFDSHTSRQRLPFIMTAIISGTVAAFLMILAIKYTGLGVWLGQETEPIIQIHTQAEGKLTSIHDYEQNIIQVVEEIGPSVVMIATNTLVEKFNFFSGSVTQNVQGIGSGVVFRKDGYILTNNHVINGLRRTANEIAVVFSDGNSYPAQVVGVDSQTDLAMIKVERQGLAEPTWGNSDQTQAGQTAIAIGNPFEESLKNTVTVGVVSATGRTIKVNDNLQLRNMIQTDASINLGSSGGPLLDSSGAIIGINTLIASHSQGIGFSIPSNTARSVGLQLIDKGYVSRPGLGIVYVHFNKKTVKLLEDQLNKALPVKEGILILKVLSGSEAEEVGLRPGDIIVSINGKKAEVDLIREVVANYPLGTKLQLMAIRAGKTIRFIAKISEMNL